MHEQRGALASDFSAGKASDLDTYNTARAGYDYDYQNRLADLANTSQEKLLGYSNTYTSGLAQAEQNKEQQLRAAHQEALTQTQQQLAQLRAEEAARQQAQTRQTKPSGGGDKYDPTPTPAPTTEKSNWVPEKRRVTPITGEGTAMRGNRVQTERRQTLK